MITLLKLSTLWFISYSIGSAQDSTSIIYIKNGSFEGLPACCIVPEGWVDCGFRDETPPDIQPAPKGKSPLFEVTADAYDGKTYLGMVVRQDGTYECVSQKLEKVLTKGKCYSFSIYLMRSSQYLSAVKSDFNNNIMYSELKAFITPTILRIWGGIEPCDHTELLTESNVIENTKWTLYKFKFAPERDLQYLELEAFFDPDETNLYNGNILLDKASDIKLIPCEAHR